jgi:hypothetical protein
MVVGCRLSVVGCGLWIAGCGLSVVGLPARHRPIAWQAGCQLRVVGSRVVNALKMLPFLLIHPSHLAGLVKDPQQLALLLFPA